MLPPRKSSVDWTNIIVGLAIAGAGAMGGRFVSQGDSLATLRAQVDQLMPRVAALESKRCR